MSAPTSEALSTTAKNYFSAQGIELPMNWQPKGPLYPDAFSQPELSTPSNPSTTLYHEPTRNQYHTGAARTLSREYEQYIDQISVALSNAIDKWMKIASVVSLDVMGPVGTLLPGGVTGPVLYSMIMADAPQITHSDRKYSRAIAAAVSDGWGAWQQGLSGILNFPGFAGAPTVNTPAPVMTLASKGEPDLAQYPLSQAMERNLNDAGALHASTLFASVANAFFTQFQVFKTSTLVTGVTITAAAPPAATAAGDTGSTAAEEAAIETNASPTPVSDGDTEPSLEDSADVPEIEPEPAPAAAPNLAGKVIPTPGNFV